MSEQIAAQTKHIGDLVVQGFGNLKRKYSQLREARVAGTVNRVNSREIHYNRLHSSLLPLLRQQIQTISILLEPQALWNEPESRLRQVLEIQPELDFNLSEIDSAALIVCPGSIHSTTQTDLNDQELKEFKTYRLIELDGMINFTIHNICSIFHDAPEKIEQMQLSTGQLFDEWDGDLVSAHEDSSRTAVEWIGYTIRHLKGSELDVVEDCGRCARPGIDELLDRVISIVDPTIPPTRFSHRRLIRQPIIQLTKLIIPIIKLVQLFFKKLSKAGLNNKKSLNLPAFTQMNSNQLKALSRSAGKFYRDLNELVRLLTDADARIGEALVIDHQLLIQTAQRLVINLEAPLLSIFLYFIPLINHLPDQNFYHTWFVTWNILINAAVHNFVQLARNLN
ncbi:hypothetical protein PGT21_026460 [Puccinia graminis f. sp. tritici]|uniref:Uncharacterized protein n=1 Tax=Puccinia graminis f. sp. tritici TaxID=56615 RepID=A0A5B0QYQ0_PUCGR|nr:hypothetical protein PGT21_026460 [Puccinia graminis f. sp. tritici]